MSIRTENFWIRLIFLWCLLGLSSKIVGVPFKSSLIVPCYPGHAHHLYNLLKLYEHQTELPDEVIIALSQANLVSTEIIESISRVSWAFPVTLILVSEKLYAGENRNIACALAQGDILVCQDADDIPHPQRIEIIKYFFTQHDVNHLMHTWSDLKECDEALFETWLDLTIVPHIYPPTYAQARLLRPTNGNVAIRRHVFDRIHWSNLPRGQDVVFNRQVYECFDACIVVMTPLLGYRRYLSSQQVLRLLRKYSNKRSVRLQSIHKPSVIRLSIKDLKGKNETQVVHKEVKNI